MRRHDSFELKINFQKLYRRLSRHIKRFGGRNMKTDGHYLPTTYSLRATVYGEHQTFTQQKYTPVTDQFVWQVNRAVGYKWKK